MTKVNTYKLKAGSMLGRHYRILELLGDGWEGEVYQVEEIKTGIIRAAKLFYKHRYKNKNKPHINYAKKLYKLHQCPIVIQYHHQDTFTINGEEVEFLISDFVNGDVLANYLAKQPQKRLQPFEALHLFYALVLGIEQIHFIGDYHGDVHLDNVIVRRKGIHFDVNLIDVMPRGKATKALIQEDVYDLITVLYQMIGGDKYYHRMPEQVKSIILGRKRSLIAKHFKMAGHLRLYLENLEWD